MSIINVDARICFRVSQHTDMLAYEICNHGHVKLLFYYSSQLAD